DSTRLDSTRFSNGHKPSPRPTEEIRLTNPTRDTKTTWTDVASPPTQSPQPSTHRPSPAVATHPLRFPTHWTQSPPTGSPDSLSLQQPKTTGLNSISHQQHQPQDGLHAELPIGRQQSASCHLLLPPRPPAQPQPQP
ncbi:hypothetical protein B0T18DRAFT_447363, partial [Schizothecium vesticola]